MLRDNSIHRISDERLLIRWQELHDEWDKYIDLAVRGPVRLRATHYGNAKQRGKTWAAFDAEIKRRKALFT